jgi:glucosamine-6-phosphate deaminase
MHLERTPSIQAAAARAADVVCEVVARDREAALILPAGRTPIPLYEELVRRAQGGTLDLARAHLFQLDEMVGVGPRDVRSFHAFLLRHLLARVPRTAGRDHLLDGSARDPAQEIERHARALTELGGSALAILGLGRNGHVAFNEPGARPADGARVVDLAPATRLSLQAGFGPSAPERGITLGLAELAAARRLVVLVTGASKADVLREWLAGRPADSLPASHLAAHRELVVVADEEACSLLGATSRARSGGS